ncbi:MAG: GTPase [Flavobacteriaceae bacterium CG_4_8_14_3_um_filter_34_10]|nr:GTPase [Flavobacteriia bacterium]OIP52388.1 MAG: GTPase [Flavobacteriaceae bacterium CG2_30_34_30]PIQ18598.1 MAG: GTPase [Flavobacteriaceae bacterium CG18_big_fil_WC_8_21_14_2_50_34_36]PIV51565.1 MAG: GTPase [Flavobacteriaceae bacterium CG02_land_8_20_14_3_00_34_13]PIX08146.1 MAG: GTPase [Flavobacteriaceae bacterium CG_4_8_14_3_um_filter_34_10]PIZ07420.1 MAG: GTPase [Flavobacteriaceae bacterium CG_4_10_14_0_8_um_filter_34_31]PJC08446.1 MAG: GTPase [Flavobacteriaceae bacterium CG_4_9_14_0_8
MLLFVYNANSGKINGYLDALHKVVSPKTYACNLCDITYGIFKEKKDWKKFRETSKTPMEFLHADEFKKKYASKFGHKFTFPIVLLDNANDLEIFIQTKELNEMKDVDALIQLITERNKNL